MTKEAEEGDGRLQIELNCREKEELWAPQGLLIKGSCLKVP